jgi:hypothetical protein
MTRYLQNGEINRVIFKIVSKFFSSETKVKMKRSYFDIYYKILNKLYGLDISQDQFSIILRSINNPILGLIYKPNTAIRPIFSIISPYGAEAHGIKTQTKLMKTILETFYQVRIFDTSNEVYSEREQIYPALTMITKEREQPSDFIIANIGNGKTSLISLLLTIIFKNKAIIHDGNMSYFKENTTNLNFYYQNELYIKKYLLNNSLSFKDISDLYRAETILIENLSNNENDSDYPYCLPLIQAKPSAIFTTSQEMLDNLKKRFPECNTVDKIPLLAYDPIRKEKKSINELKFASSGFLTDQKKPEVVGELFGKLSKINKEWNFYWVGEPKDHNSVFKLMDSYHRFGGVEDKIRIEVTHNDEEFNSLISQMDFMFQLRRFSNYETSGSILTSLFGSVITVTDIEFNDEFLKDAPVIKLENGVGANRILEEIQKYIFELDTINKTKSEIHHWAKKYKSSSDSKIQKLFCE